MATEGLTVYLGSRRVERGREVARDIGGDVRVLPLDVTDAVSIAKTAAQIDALDILVNSAGIMVDGTPPTGADIDSFRATFETNVFGVVAVTNAFLPVLRRSAHPRIINISSGTGSLAWSTGPNPQFPFETGGRGAAYRSSKTALNALTIFYAQKLAAEGFKVNALAPGLRATNLNGRAAAGGGDPAEAAGGAVRLALLEDDGPTATLFSWDGTVAPW